MDEIITLNDRDFLIVNNIFYNNIDYIYAIATDDTGDIALVREFEKDGQFYVESVTDENEFNEVLKLIK